MCGARGAGGRAGPCLQPCPPRARKRGVRRDDACGTARLTPAADSPHSFRRPGSRPTHMSLELLRDRLLTALLEPGENGIAPAVPLVVRDGDAILLLRSGGLLLL